MADLNLKFVRRNNPFIQNLLISACLFCNPGLYLAVTLLGAGGGRPSSVSMADTSNGVLYGVFFFSAIGAGPILNLFGPRASVAFAVTGYPVYIGAMWYFDAFGHLWYPIFAGAYLGLCAGCLWTTAAWMANTLAEEKEKGTWRAIQWTANVSGAAVGACIALGINWNATSAGVPRSVYITFIVIQASSIIFALLMLPPEKLIRADGTAIAIFKKMSLKDAMLETKAACTDWRVLLLIPTMFAPEVFFPLQASINAYAFNLRTRTLNSLLNNLIQIPVTIGMGLVLDREKLGTRKVRAFIGITIDAVWITGAYIAQTIWLSSWKFDRSVPGPSIDVRDKAYAGAVVIYMLYAAQYGIFQNLVIYVLGGLTNEPRRSAAMSGLFVGGKTPQEPLQDQKLTLFAYQ
ncbi:hypothetical protein A1O3_02155 [Capronia epimyces CBS 606.96]|uniref:Uncharacterized protein n=1 Tax=Capronia epimyces CBS 606.96 TaxID=1182542 RepID=W9YIK6_9EURO|nr:uncharacterized protein A1O3_02155 [Capronia epimyces CBS 606.96]EXJ89091.1 hypothetical protein A1O3_02155 [Capronia epimyces CBS 606.96]